ncbi:MAG: CMGC/GSK protein kinase [Amphiamblys sp. WSBS2006]|nr:MAG: CMGC/GSK protein kinase [Amphiamblys sp. WSBS2006]
MPETQMPEKNTELNTAWGLLKKNSAAIQTVSAFDNETLKECAFRYRYINDISSGTFGAVGLVRDMLSLETHALKIVFQDPKHKNRELAIMKAMAHPSIVSLRKYFYMETQKKDTFLGLVMECLPESLSAALETSQEKVLEEVEILVFQVLNALVYLHRKGIAHRDLKPGNILLDMEKKIAKICDFGCAKRLSAEQENISYICARYYRAPELLRGETVYTPKIDMWSLGCIIAEIALGRPLWVGIDNTKQLSEIAKVLGINAFKKQRAQATKKKEAADTLLSFLLADRLSPDGVNLVEKMLAYNPKDRISAAEAIEHAFFKETRRFCHKNKVQPETLSAYLEKNKSGLQAL